MLNRVTTRIVAPAIAGLLLATSVATADLDLQVGAAGTSVAVGQVSQLSVPSEINTPAVRAATRSFPEAAGMVIVGVLCTYRYWRRGRVI